MTNLTAVNLTQPKFKNISDHNIPQNMGLGDLASIAAKDQILFGANKGFLEKLGPDISDRDLAWMIYQAAEVSKDAALVKKILERREDHTSVMIWTVID